MCETRPRTKTATQSRARLPRVLQKSNFAASYSRIVAAHSGIAGFFCVCRRRFIRLLVYAPGKVAKP